MFSTGFTLFSVLPHFPQFSLYARSLMLFHLTLTWFSILTNLLMFLSFKTLTSIIKISWPILKELIDLVISNDSAQMVNFHIRIPGCDSHSRTLYIFSFWR